MKSSKVRLPITIWSDFICPWCYIAKSRIRRLQKDLSKELALEIELLPFQLYPQVPREGIDKKVFATRTKPGMGKSLRAEAAIEGIELNYHLIDTIPNSLEAHRLLYLIPEARRKRNLAEAIFQAYFEKGVNIGIPDELMSIARIAEVPQDILDEYYNEETGRQEVLSLINSAKDMYIRSVPVVILDHQFQIPGLQSYEVWEQYIRRAIRIKDKD